MKTTKIRYLSVLIVAEDYTTKSHPVKTYKKDKVLKRVRDPESHICLHLNPFRPYADLAPKHFIPQSHLRCEYFVEKVVTTITKCK